MKEAIDLSIRRSRANWSWRPEFTVSAAAEHEALGWVEAARNETYELGGAIDKGDRAEIQMELGDALMDLHHVAWVLGLNPDTALLGSVRKIERRMNYVEKRIKDPRDLKARQRLWAEAKRQEKQG